MQKPRTRFNFIIVGEMAGPGGRGESGGMRSHLELAELRERSDLELAELRERSDLELAELRERSDLELAEI